MVLRRIKTNAVSSNDTARWVIPWKRAVLMKINVSNEIRSLKQATTKNTKNLITLKHGSHFVINFHLSVSLAKSFHTHVLSESCVVLVNWCSVFAEICVFLLPEFQKEL